MRAFAVLIAFLIGTIGLTALTSAGDNTATAQSIIRSQEEAFSRDDAAAAYAFASPALKSWYRSPDAFMFMVRNGYAPVYRHRSFEFGLTTTKDGKILQEVQIVDADGVPWDALYTLEPQSDGSLTISSCILRKAVTS